MTEHNMSFLSVFSNNFIVISGEITIKSALILAIKEKTEYLIISAKRAKTHSRYVIPSFMFTAAVERFLPSLFSTISSFLKLNESNSDRSISIPGDPLTDPEAIHILSGLFPPKDFLILIHDNEVIGVIDPRKDLQVKARKYVLRGLEITMSKPKEDYFYGSFTKDFTKKLDHVASLYLLHNHHNAAEIYYRKGLDINQDKFGSDSPYVVRSMISLADLYHSQNDVSQATYFCKQAWDSVKKNITKWQDDYQIWYDKKNRLMAISEILEKLAEVLKKAGLDSTSRDVYLKIFFIKSQVEEITKKEQERPDLKYDDLFVSKELRAARRFYSISEERRFSMRRPYGYSNGSACNASGPDSDKDEIEFNFEPLRRYPYVEFPDTLPIGKIAKLIINITVQPSSTSIEPFNIIANKSQHAVPIEVSVIFVEPNILELIGNDNAVIHVPVQAMDSKPVEFLVRAKKEGYQTIILQFYNPQQQMYVGELEIKTHVVEATRTIQDSDIYKKKDLDFLWTSGSDQTSSSSLAAAADLIIEIRENKSYDQYRFDFSFLSADINSEYYPRKTIASLPLKQKPEKEIRAIINDIEKLIKYPRDFEYSLSNKGYILYDNLFPKQVKEKYWKIKDKIKSIHIFSDEPWIPWEILQPWKGSEGGEYFLCQQYSFTRWPIKPYNNSSNYYRLYNQEFQIKKAEVIIPSDTKLINALQESELISWEKIRVSV